MFERGVELAIGNELARQPDAFAEMHEVRRGIDVHLLARRFEHGAKIGNGRAFAVGPGHMDDGRQPILRTAEIIQ